MVIEKLFPSSGEATFYRQVGLWEDGRQRVNLAMSQFADSTRTLGCYYAVSTSFAITCASEVALNCIAIIVSLIPQDVSPETGASVPAVRSPVSVDKMLSHRPHSGSGRSPKELSQNI